MVKSRETLRSCNDGNLSALFGMGLRSTGRPEIRLLFTQHLSVNDLVVAKIAFKVSQIISIELEYP